MRLIDADAFKDYIVDGIADHEDIPPSQFSIVEAAAKGFLLDIDEQPTISPDEVRGVVRCKDCTFGESATDGDGNPCVLCGNSMVFDYPYAHDPDWFCADGEMKGAEDGTTEYPRRSGESDGGERMRDYAELILDLRRHHCDAKEDDTQEVCEECAYDVIVADKSKFNSITYVCTCGLMHRAADAIEELLDKVPMWHPVSEKPTRKNPTHARDTFLVRLESGCIKTLTYEYDNSDRCRPGMLPLFDEGWGETVVPVTHWMELPLFEPQKGVE